MQLVEQLKQTTKRQRSAYTNLENVVSQGYEYYQQSFNEKQLIREKKAKLEPKEGGMQRYKSLENTSLTPMPMKLMSMHDRNNTTTSEAALSPGAAPHGSKLKQLQMNKSSNVSLPAMSPYADIADQVNKNTPSAGGGSGRGLSAYD